MIRRLIILLLIVGCEETLEPEDCAGVAGGTAYLDECGGCDANVNNDCIQDCAGEWGGAAVLSGCDNLCNSTAVVDDCGVCGGYTEATPVGTWNLVSFCEYDYGDCNVNCIAVELEAYCDTSSYDYVGTSTTPDNKEDCNNLYGSWVKELISVLTVNTDMTGTLEFSARYDEDDDVNEVEFIDITLAENSSGSYLVTSSSQPSDIEIFLTLCDNGESLYLQVISEGGGDDCSLLTFTKQ